MTALGSMTFYSPNDSPYLQQCWATSPTRTISSSRALSRGPGGISAEIHRKLVKVWASKLAFSPD